MWIENIDLDDFGCFNRARLADLGDGLTLVAGPQRAGKTTLMEALRRLGYGVSRGESVPPEDDRYDVDADVVADGHRYRLSIDGYADPALTPLDGGPVDHVGELYDLPKMQYGQIYTISLAELRARPPSLENGDVDLTSVLLGAAYGDVRDVPLVRDRFETAANDVGGTAGRAVYQLGDPVETIELGLERKQAAIAQVDTYERRYVDLEEVTDRIDDVETALAGLEDERRLLTTVEASHETYDDLRALRHRLAGVDAETLESFPLEKAARVRSILERWDESREAFEDATRSFETAVALESVSDYRRRLLDARDELERFATQLSGWRERVDVLERRRDEIASRRAALKSHVAQLHPAWDGSLDRVRAADTDQLTRGAVEEIVSRYRARQTDLEAADREIERLERHRRSLAERIESAHEAHGLRILETQRVALAAGFAASLIAGAGVGSVTGTLPGVLVTALVLAVTGVVVAARIDAVGPSDDGVNVETLRTALQETEADLEAQREQRATLAAELDEMDERLAPVREQFDLPANASPPAIGSFFEELVVLREDVREFQTSQRALAATEASFRDDLAHVGATLADVGVLDACPENPLESASQILSAVGRADEHREMAADVARARRALEDLEAQASAALGSWDGCPPWSSSDPGSVADALRAFEARSEEIRDLRQANERYGSTRTILENQLRSVADLLADDSENVGSGNGDSENVGGGNGDSENDDGDSENDDGDSENDDGDSENDDGLVEAFERVLERYDGREGVSRRLDAIDGAIDEHGGELSNLREQKVDLKRELDELASDDDVREAHEVIERGRRRLEPLAERYAENRIAQYLLDELHDRFVDRTTGPLLADAGRIFERITDGEYVEIGSKDEFEELAFEARLADGNGHRSHETDQLSRATMEQLFLSVRLARIQRHERPLPVVLDDSLTNFDPAHADRTLEAIAELCATHQVFLLTCHPSLIERVDAAMDVDCRYLESGRFRRTDANELRAALAGGGLP